MAPANIPIPLRMVKLVEKVGTPSEFGGPKAVRLVPLKLSVPVPNENVKSFIVKAGTKDPVGKRANVMRPDSDHLPAPNGVKLVVPNTVVGNVRFEGLGIPEAAVSAVPLNVNGIVSA